MTGDTISLTTAQALVRYLCTQFSWTIAALVPLFAGIFGATPHSNGGNHSGKRRGDAGPRGACRTERHCRADISQRSGRRGRCHSGDWHKVAGFHHRIVDRVPAGCKFISIDTARFEAIRLRGLAMFATLWKP